jgi:hypothetical protein
MGRHLFSAEIAFPTRGDAGNNDLVSLTEGRDRGAGFVNYSDTFVTENPPRGDSRNISFEDVEVRPTYRRSRDAYDCIMYGFEHGPPV